VKKICGTCKFFRSFKDLCEDPLEPEDCGFCRKEAAPRGVHYFDDCEKWEKE